MKRITSLFVSFILIYITASLIAGVLMGIILIIFKLDPKAMTDSIGIFISFCMSMGLLFGLLYLMRKQMRISLPKLVSKFHRINLPMILIAMVGVFAIGVVIEPLLAILPEWGIDMLNNLTQGGTWAIITGVIAAPLLEEYLFRGVMQTNMVKGSSPLVGIIAASVIFGVIHVVPVQAVNAIFAGFILGTVYYLTQSLWTVIIIHFLNNGLSFWGSEYFGEDMTTRDLFSSDAVYYTVYALSLLVMAWLLVAAVNKIQKKRVSLSVGDTQINN